MTNSKILVVSFASPYELSGLIYLLYYNSLLPDNLVITGFYSGCGSIFTNSMKLIQEGQKKAVWGVHDSSARARLPKDIMTLSMLFSMVVEIIDKSFVITDNWTKNKNTKFVFS